MKWQKTVKYLRLPTDDEELMKLLPQIIEKQIHPRKSEIVKYLKRTPLYTFSLGMATDVLLERQSNYPRLVIGSYNSYTDGTWGWRDHLVYYYEKYNIKLPQEFLDHMEKRRWSPPWGITIKLLNKIYPFMFKTYDKWFV